MGSLRRLKRVRGNENSSLKPLTASTTAAGGTGEKDKGLVSDDDKIRLQLLVDVKHYIRTMESLGIMPKEEVPVIDNLQELVVKATKACYDDYLQKLGS